MRRDKKPIDTTSEGELTRHIDEALEALAKLSTSLKSGEVEDEFDLIVQMGHVYHHLNTAWNRRTAVIGSQTDEEFYLDRRYPRAISAFLAR